MESGQLYFHSLLWTHGGEPHFTDVVHLFASFKQGCYLCCWSVNINLFIRPKKVNILWEMVKVPGIESIWVCCIFLSLSVSLLIRKDKRSYPVMTCMPRQDNAAGELRE